MSARAVDVSLSGREVLHGIDLTVGTGQLVALLGANGSGKSTLVRSVVGLVPVAQGTIELFGTERSRFRDWGRIGYVPQRVTASSGVPATVTEIVTSGRLTGRSWFRPTTRTDRQAVGHAIDTVGLTERAHDSVARLSGGQQQRALIARALSREPDLLILDEPIAGVDRASQEALAGALERLSAQGATVLVVLHELGVLAPLIDRVVVLRAGRVVHDGGPPQPESLDDRPSAGHRDFHDHVHPHADELQPAERLLP